MKLVDEPDTYISYFRDIENRNYRFKIKDLNMIESIHLTDGVNENILLIDNDHGECKLYVPEQLPEEMKKLYSESKRATEFFLES